MHPADSFSCLILHTDGVSIAGEAKSDRQQDLQWDECFVVDVIIIIIIIL